MGLRKVSGTRGRGVESTGGGVSREGWRTAGQQPTGPGVGQLRMSQKPMMCGHGACAGWSGLLVIKIRTLHQPMCRVQTSGLCCSLLLHLGPIV
jgi:hypothetical protein